MYNSVCIVRMLLVLHISCCFLLMVRGFITSPLLSSHCSRAMKVKAYPASSSRYVCSKMEDLHPLIFAHLGPSVHSDLVLMAASTRQTALQGDTL